MTPGPAGAGVRRAVGELRDGARVLVGSPLLRGLLPTTWAYWTANAALTALLVPFVVERLHSPGQDLGYLITGLGLGYLVGSVVSRLVVGRYPTRLVLAGAYLAVGLSFLGMFNAPNLAVATACTALAGIPGAVAGVATRHRMQADTPDAVLGRVSAAFALSDALAALAGAAAAPVVLALAGLAATLDLFSAAVLVAAAAVLVLLPPAAGARDGAATAVRSAR